MKDQIEIEKHHDAIRNRSGNVTIDCKLTSFLYTLMRDHVNLGDIEDIMLNHMSDEPVSYCNGWLAKYANDVATRLKTKRPETKVLRDADWFLAPDEMQM